MAKNKLCPHPRSSSAAFIQLKAIDKRGHKVCCVHVSMYVCIYVCICECVSLYINI